MSSQSSSNLVVVMGFVQTYLCRFVGPILMFIGTIGCIVNLIVFSQKTLRKSPCSVYFIVHNISSFLYIYISSLILTMGLGYNTDPTIHNLLLCRLYRYGALLFHVLCPFYLLLASFDRALITSRNALTRRRSTYRLAYICISIGTIFWALFHSHVLILAEITEISPHVFICLFQQGIEIAFLNYFTLIKEIVLISLMILCGLRSVNNIRNVGRVVRTGNERTPEGIVPGHSLTTAFSKDRQLMFMVIVDTISYGIFNLGNAIRVVYQRATQNYVKSSDQLQIENNIQNIVFFTLGIPYCINCYTNFLVSKTYRKVVKKVFLCK